MSLWKKMKTLAKEHIEETRKINREIEAMTDMQLHEKAIREGGKYADAWVSREKRKKELRDRVKGK